ncbi:hypothetical protein SUDANB180_06567 [Streptomyces sp. enrichment culture]
MSSFSKRSRVLRSGHEFDLEVETLEETELVSRATGTCTTFCWVSCGGFCFTEE